RYQAVIAVLVEVPHNVRARGRFANRSLILVGVPNLWKVRHFAIADVRNLGATTTGDEKECERAEPQRAPSPVSEVHAGPPLRRSHLGGVCRGSISASSCEAIAASASTWRTPPRSVWQPDQPSLCREASAPRAMVSAPPVP